MLVIVNTLETRTYIEKQEYNERGCCKITANDCHMKNCQENCHRRATAEANQRWSLRVHVVTTKQIGDADNMTWIKISLQYQCTVNIDFRSPLRQNKASS